MSSRSPSERRSDTRKVVCLRMNDLEIAQVSNQRQQTIKVQINIMELNRQANQPRGTARQGQR